MAAAAAGSEGDDVTSGVDGLVSRAGSNRMLPPRGRCFTWNHQWWPMMFLGLTPPEKLAERPFGVETSHLHTPAALW
ncbi:hypothetical protein CBI38_30495 [Rhodococcus oxybenzonivorans]|uniref:Uncharacterized protein n=1 Tax=Rhodococcus oxybenzonivorans TaxID=1990687 RepID=A0A2S2C382_9NOCA|nr:hypothetical protein CBI38_30495 [Rhodococcus oxybenzonivorans]